MSSLLGVLCGLIAMAGWGIGDFVVARAVRRASTLTVFVWSQVYGLVLYVPVLLVINNFQIPSQSVLITVLAAGLIVTVAYLSLYKGLQVGKVSLITPISACWALVTVVISSLLLRESLTPIQVLAVSLALFGGVSASFRWGEVRVLNFRSSIVGIQYAFVAMFGLGLYYVMLDVLVSELGWLLPILFVRLVVIVYLLTYSITIKRSLAFPMGATKLVILVGFLEFVAFFFYGVGINSEFTAIVAPVSAASPVVTIALARLILRERLELNQKIGVFSVIIAVVLIFI